MQNVEINLIALGVIIKVGGQFPLDLVLAMGLLYLHGALGRVGTLVAECLQLSAIEHGFEFADWGRVYSK